VASGLDKSRENCRQIPVGIALGTSLRSDRRLANDGMKVKLGCWQIYSCEHSFPIVHCWQLRRTTLTVARPSAR
jgi:hypothetical protein